MSAPILNIRDAEVSRELKHGERFEAKVASIGAKLGSKKLGYNPDTAHQIVNTGAAALKFLAVSTMIDTDIWQYPDSGKWGGVGGRPPNRPGEATFTSRYVADGAELDYWKGE
ncbi:MAG TPA: hypothetical protein VF287_09140 [Usitatibacter sp.]